MEFQLTERGYTNIDALDGSRGMLEKAKEKGIYKDYIHAWLGPEPIEDLENGDVPLNVFVFACFVEFPVLFNLLYF